MLPERIRSALVWTAAFAFAVALFFLISKYLRALPPTDPVAVGRVTVDGASKLRDYVAAAIFYLFVPFATFAFARAGERFLRRVTPAGREMSTALLFAIPFWLAPFFYLSTRKEGWTAVLPLLLAGSSVVAFRYAHQHAWVRRLFTAEQRLSHALLLTEGLSWVVFRYVVTGQRIAHFPTLFLEIVFVLFLMLVFWAAAVLISTTAARLRGALIEDVLRSFAVGALPLTALPVLGLFPIDPALSALAIVGTSAVAIVILIQRETTPSPRRVRLLLAWVLIPAILFAINVASMASPWQWTDLFHRGESFGPASDYLRGKVPYRDVFVLHGMLDDGMLDAWLMEWFGRHPSVGVWRLVILDSVGLAAVWLLSMAAFGSIPLSIASLAVSLVTSVGNQRVMLEILSALFLIAAIRSGRRLPVFISGVIAAAALFYSLETGLYSIIGALATIAALAVVQHWRAAELRVRPIQAGSFFLGGLLAGAAPVLAWLSFHGALGAFFETSFVAVPRIIDAVWSLPFPKLGATFRDDPSLRTLSDFVLGERLRFVLNPLVLGISLVYLLARFAGRRMSLQDQVLLALTMCGIVAQRSALGRADFPHQYFSAFLIGPILVFLLAAFARALGGISKRNAEGRAFASLTAFALAPALFVALWVPDLVNARINDLTAYRARLAGGANADPTFAQIVGRVNAVRDAVARIVPPGQPIFDFSNQPALYFFADRPNPTRFYQVPILSPPEFQREAIAALERSRTELILRRASTDREVFDGITNEMRAPALAAYIDGWYRFDGSVRGVELWRRIAGNRRAPDLNALLRKHRVPSAEEVANAPRERFFFPAVASREGIAGSDWRTDLIVMNPHLVKVDFRLRYLSNDRVERESTIGPRSVLTYRDVVGELLAARGTLGALIIEGPASRMLIARTRTSDVGRGARGPFVAPMTMADAASAEGQHRALMISGFPAGGRMNIGVMNVGRSPARFAISAFHNEGWPAGSTTVQAGALEQGSYFLGQAETHLGTTVDERLIIRIDVDQGEIIAYASVVDDATGESVFLAGVPVAK